jgi:hypothetical protein
VGILETVSPPTAEAITMGFDAGCPGRDRSKWTPDDIFEVACTHCSEPVEFFKDDAKRLCPKCGTCNVNPKLDIGCAAWCSAADKCSVARNAGVVSL